jgi:hypothetical protein
LNVEPGPAGWIRVELVIPSRSSLVLLLGTPRDPGAGTHCGLLVHVEACIPVVAGASGPREVPLPASLAARRPLLMQAVQLDDLGLNYGNAVPISGIAAR